MRVLSETNTSVNENINVAQLNSIDSIQFTAFVFFIIGSSLTATVGYLLWLLSENQKRPEFGSMSIVPYKQSKQLGWYQQENEITGYYEIDQKDLIKTKTRIGRGNFGEVFKWILQREEILMEVAVKRCRIYTDEQRYMIAKELEMMCLLGRHPNIVAFLGAVTINPRATLMIMEYADCGNLLEFLRRRRKIFKNQITWEENENNNVPKWKKSYNFVDYPAVISNDLDSLTTLDLISYAFQIANGMKHLASILCVHRDLALRNCLITHNKTIRVADFGLAREQKNEYYRMKTDSELPYNWMPLESMKELDANVMTRFNEKTDIWSFGICLYELFTLGDSPYEGISDVLKFLEKGERLAEPDLCPTEIYQLMEMCWARDPMFRPNFSMCADILKNQMKNLSGQAFHELENKLGDVAEKQGNQIQFARHLSS